MGRGPAVGADRVQVVHSSPAAAACQPRAATRRSGQPRVGRRRLLAAVLVACLAVSGCTADDSVEADGYRYISATAKGTVIDANERQPAGILTATDLQGESFDLQANGGRVLLLNFWGQWCGPCAVETPILDQLYRTYPTEDVEFVGFAVRDQPDLVRQFVADNEITYPIVLDFNGESALRLGNVPMRGLPVTVLIDNAGRVAAVYLGAVTALDVRPAIDLLLTE